ncbi:hypothetical protein TNIN_487711 [Trichonephila inaurata madagascariensis]|uniref:Uncharacterized protein n=1 Tax=Trichonephila inaurata madagascariensis TaxID=2747483 RepID=A0A8X6YKP9_9ARAC|nr:hypothetical protein TNIN_487711 [Trichonephila inaurata madagascariensis]
MASKCRDRWGDPSQRFWDRASQPISLHGRSLKLPLGWAGVRRSGKEASARKSTHFPSSIRALHWLVGGYFPKWISLGKVRKLECFSERRTFVETSKEKY